MNSKNLTSDFDRTFDSLTRTMLGLPSTLPGMIYGNSTMNYPPYNILQDEDGLNVELQLAVAGWNRNDLEVEVVKDVLHIRGTKSKDVEETEENYVHRGISQKNFTRSFTLGANLEVDKVKYEDGILRIFMEKIVPEEDKPRLIQIK